MGAAGLTYPLWGASPCWQVKSSNPGSIHRASDCRKAGPCVGERLGDLLARPARRRRAMARAPRPLRASARASAPSASARLSAGRSPTSSSTPQAFIPLTASVAVVEAAGRVKPWCASRAGMRQTAAQPMADAGTRDSRRLSAGTSPRSPAPARRKQTASEPPSWIVAKLERRQARSCARDGARSSRRAAPRQRPKCGATCARRRARLVRCARRSAPPTPSAARRRGG